MNSNSVPARSACSSSDSASLRVQSRIARLKSPRRDSSGMASSAAPALPNWAIRSRKVTGPTFSERMRRSEASRSECESSAAGGGGENSVSGSGPGTDLRLLTGRETTDVGAMLVDQKRGEDGGQQSGGAVAGRQGPDRHHKGGNQR